MLINLINRAKKLAESGVHVPASKELELFLKNNYTLIDFQHNPELLTAFGRMDDHDIGGAIKLWVNHSDKVLSTLCSMVLDRKLMKIKLVNEPIKKVDIEKLRDKISKEFNISRSDSHYFMTHGEVSNKAYISSGQTINILTKKGEVVDIAQAADLPNIKAISSIVKKYYLGYPKNLTL